MRYLRRSFFLELAICFSIFTGPALFPAAAADNSPELEDFLHRVEQSAATINTFTCDFIQVRHLAIFPKPVKFSGRLALSRPDRLRWEFIKPLPSVLVLNGEKGLKCSDEGPIRQFSLADDPVMRMVAAQMWAWTSGSYRDLQDDFDFTLLPGPTLAFSPKNKGAGSFIRKITVIFDPDFLQPLEVEISEPGGDRTIISFSGYQRNIDLPERSFIECRFP
jgi:outer membrane lipoprotein-sorting protein